MVSLYIYIEKKNNLIKQFINKLKLVQQKYEPNLNLKSYLLMNLNLACVERKNKKTKK